LPLCFLYTALLTPFVCSGTCPKMSALPTTSVLMRKWWSFSLALECNINGSKYTMQTYLWSLDTELVLKNPQGAVVAKAVQPFFLMDRTTFINDCKNNETFQYEYITSGREGPPSKQTCLSEYDIKVGNAVIAKATKAFPCFSINVNGTILDANGVLLASSKPVAGDSNAWTITHTHAVSEASDPRLLLLLVALEFVDPFRASRFGPCWTSILWAVVLFALVCCCCVIFVRSRRVNVKVELDPEESKPMIIRAEQPRNRLFACCGRKPKRGVSREMQGGENLPKR